MRVDDRERARANRSGRAENGDALHTCRDSLRESDPCGSDRLLAGKGLAVRLASDVIDVFARRTPSDPTRRKPGRTAYGPTAKRSRVTPCRPNAGTVERRRRKQQRVDAIEHAAVARE